METKKMMISLTLAALLVASWALPAAATDYAASNYLPLAVGNSWTYEHSVVGNPPYDDDERDLWDRTQWSTYTAQYPSIPQFTITVERTEVIDGKTYFVISDMPANWPPAPPHFIAGKKLRWEGTRLMERTPDGEQAIFRFDGTASDYTTSTMVPWEGMDLYETEYAIPTVEGDNQVKVVAGWEPVPWYSFTFWGNDEGGRGCGFLWGYGSGGCGWRISGSDVAIVSQNRVAPLRGVIGGNRVEFSDALIPTSSSSSSWGRIKNTFFAHNGRTSP